MTTTLTQFNTVELEALLEKHDFVGAKKIIDEVIDQDLTKEEKGAAYVKLATIYLNMTNKINAQYIQQLDNALALSKKLKLSEKGFEKTIKTEEIKQQLAEDSK